MPRFLALVPGVISWPGFSFGRGECSGGAAVDGGCCAPDPDAEEEHEQENPAGDHESVENDASDGHPLTGGLLFDADQTEDQSEERDEERPTKED